MHSDRLFGPSLTTAKMAAAVSDEAWLAAMLRFESALAAVQARLGLISEDAAAAIASACEQPFDAGVIGREVSESASPVVPLVSALRQTVGKKFATQVHYNATSQDTLDTAMMLVARDGLELLLDGVDELAAACALLQHSSRDSNGRAHADAGGASNDVRIQGPHSGSRA